MCEVEATKSIKPVLLIISYKEVLHVKRKLPSAEGEAKKAPLSCTRAFHGAHSSNERSLQSPSGWIGDPFLRAKYLLAIDCHSNGPSFFLSLHISVRRW